MRTADISLSLSGTSDLVNMNDIVPLTLSLTNNRYYEISSRQCVAKKNYYYARVSIQQKSNNTQRPTC